MGLQLGLESRINLIFPLPWVLSIHTDISIYIHSFLQNKIPSLCKSFRERHIYSPSPLMFGGNQSMLTCQLLKHKKNRCLVKQKENGHLGVECRGIYKVQSGKEVGRTWNFPVPPNVLCWNIPVSPFLPPLLASCLVHFIQSLCCPGWPWTNISRPKHWDGGVPRDDWPWTSISPPARHDSRNLLICFDLLSLGVIVTRLVCLHHCMGTRNEEGLPWQQEKTSLGLFFVSAVSAQQVGCRLYPAIRSCRKESMQGCALTHH